MITISKKSNEIIFIDIETIKETNKIFELGEQKAVSFMKYIESTGKFTLPINNISDIWNNEDIPIALMPEFSKILCISLGYVENDIIKIKAFTSDTEYEVLKMVIESLHKLLYNRKWFCGHNIINFDIPFIIRRCIINKINVPPIMQMHEKKPWDLNFIDTMNIWKSGAYSLGISNLEIICALLGIDNPKSDMDGKILSKQYYDTKDKSEFLLRVGKYCNGDVLAVIKLFYRFQGIKLPDKIELK